MREFKGILLTYQIVDRSERYKEQKRLKAYLKGSEFFIHKGKRYFVSPEFINPNPEEGLIPEIIL